VTAIIPRGKTINEASSPPGLTLNGTEKTGTTWLDDSGISKRAVHDHQPPQRLAWCAICDRLECQARHARHGKAIVSLFRSLAENLGRISERYQRIPGETRRLISRPRRRSLTSGRSMRERRLRTVIISTNQRNSRVAIGTSRALLDQKFGSYTVGVLVHATMDAREPLRIAGITWPECPERTGCKNDIGSSLWSSPRCASDPPQLNRIAKKVSLRLGRDGRYSGTLPGLFIAFSNREFPAQFGTQAASLTIAAQRFAGSEFFWPSVQATGGAVVNANGCRRDHDWINNHTGSHCPHDRPRKC